VSYFSQAKGGRDKARVIGSVAEASPGETTAVVKSFADTVSTLGPGMVITGNIVCQDSAQIFGRVIGDIQAVAIVVGEGAHVEGNITAQEVCINGAFKGTIRGNTVKLRGAASVDGEVFSRSLTVEENVQFEGVSRRLEKPVELPTSVPSVEANPMPQMPPAPTANPVYAPVPAPAPEQTAA
jgi:cytoskeletal protein CcmA (bactofilin family)